MNNGAAASSDMAHAGALSRSYLGTETFLTRVLLLLMV